MTSRKGRRGRLGLGGHQGWSKKKEEMKEMNKRFLPPPPLQRPHRRAWLRDKVRNVDVHGSRALVSRGSQDSHLAGNAERKGSQLCSRGGVVNGDVVARGDPVAG